MADLAAASAAVGDAAASWRAFLPSREAVVEALRQYPPLDARHLPYGTSGRKEVVEDPRRQPCSRRTQSRHPLAARNPAHKSVFQENITTVSICTERAVSERALRKLLLSKRSSCAPAVHLVAGYASLTAFPSLSTLYFMLFPSLSSFDCAPSLDACISAVPCPHPCWCRRNTDGLFFCRPLCCTEGGDVYLSASVCMRSRCMWVPLLSHGETPASAPRGSARETATHSRPVHTPHAPAHCDVSFCIHCTKRPPSAVLERFLSFERFPALVCVQCALEEASQGGRRSAGELSADAAIEAHADCFFAVAEQLFEHASCLAADEEATLPQGMQGEAFPTSPPAAAASEFSEEEQAQARSRLHSMGACVLQARDSRASSLALEEALTAGVSLVGVQSVRLGVAATGQLQFLVLLCNEALSGVSPPRLPEKQHQALRAALYALRSCQENQPALLAGAERKYTQGYRSVASSPVYVDCGNGAGSPACGELQKLLRLLGEKPLFARNTGLNTTSSSDTTSSDCSGSHLINENCGAEFVQKGVRLPQRFGFPKDASEGAPCCAFDGDADRIVYFAWQRQQTPSDECSSSGFSSLEDSPAVAAANDEETMRVQLFDGDRIACLFVLLIASLLKAAEENRVGNSLHKTTAARREQANDAPAAALEPLRVGVVQTAYANGGSTRFLENLSKTVQQWEYLKIQIELRCVKTGVKNLHREASQFPLSVYFEANGHGTVLSHPAELAAWGVKVGIYQTEAFQFLQHFVALFNPATGDALADLLGVEIARTRLSLSLSQWHLLYDEFPSITAKAALWDLANSTGPFCRVFVRPSGTEDVARIYAEAPHRREAQKLADAAAQIVLQFAQSEVADRGVQV
ncbi:uncharacterized protein LOC34622871 [Cyclospora cayetanensis]|uniref:Uncharacterized protein LOC34622871 n=1 Tax=Cyclospora cayetanensis TaxID=88456 RepID=A0A6P6RUR5_9EIME|nr:uncharacterized protein LOC34622871 [Cyclospora cayetanensis]